MITLKSSREIALMKEAGKVVAKVFETCGPLIKPGVSTFEINEAANTELKSDNKSYIPKKATEGLGLKIAIGILVLVVGFFVILYFSTNHIFCQNDTGGKFGVFYTKNKIIYCFQSGQGPGDCKAVKSVSKEDLERLGYNDFESFIESLRVQIESTGLGKCQ